MHITCLSDEVRELLKGRMWDIIDFLDEVPTCPGRDHIGFAEPSSSNKSKSKGTKKKSKYQEHMSVCMKEVIKKGTPATGAMKECAAEWRKQKGE